MNSVEAGITYTGFCGHGPCPCCCGTVPRTLWSLLCNQLFDLVTNPMMGPEGTFDEVQIWSEGEITMTVTSSPYTFVMVLPDEAVPKASDIIYYGRRFFIIGAVELTGENTYTCTGCLSIDVSIVGVYAALVNLQQQVSASEAERQDAEAERSREFDEDQAEREEEFDLAQQTMREEFPYKRKRFRIDRPHPVLPREKDIPLRARTGDRRSDCGRRVPPFDSKRMEMAIPKLIS